jgi:MoaA/NifB/PqqE/SkfB family radical SAM enzyme
MHFEIDPRFVEHFHNLQQVFLYITDECNLRCTHCLYKPELILGRNIKLKTALALISDFREMGASKLNFIGGEPTLYGLPSNESLLVLIKEAKDLGYEYIRLDTNGLFNSSLLEKRNFRLLDELAFSIDGHAPKIHDSLRGERTFNRCLTNLRKAVHAGYNVHVTCCVHKGNIGRDRKGNLLVDLIIRFAEQIGANLINFHAIFRMGVPMDTWTGDVHISPMEWMNVYAEIRKNINAGKYNIKVRIPQHFVTREEFNKKPTFYGYCPAKLGERVLVHPNGIIRICSSLLGTAYGVAKYDDSRIMWEEFTNELWRHDLKHPTPCTNQRELYIDNFVPLCFSFKPEQDEIIWKEKLRWQDRHHYFWERPSIKENEKHRYAF